MPKHSRAVAMAGTALVSAGALILATPAIGANAASAPALDLVAASPLVALMSHDHGKAYGFEKLDDDDDGYVNPWAGGFSGNGYGHDDDDHDDDDHGWGFGSFFGGQTPFIGNFLTNNQDQVLAVTSMIPVFYLGPIAVGNSLLANAYYNGYEGSGTGIEGIVAYVTGQFALPQTDLVQSLVLGFTSMVPQINIGPVAVGNSLLATAYFNGYNDSATGLPGVISYVTDQLGLQSAPAAAAVAAPVVTVAASQPAAAPASVARSAAPAPASVASPESSVAEVAIASVADDSDAAVPSAKSVAANDTSGKGASTADSASAGRSAGRGSTSVKATEAGGTVKSRAARSGRSGGR